MARQSERRFQMAHEEPPLQSGIGQRREPVADDVRFVSERIGWFSFAVPTILEHCVEAPFGST